MEIKLSLCEFRLNQAEKADDLRTPCLALCCKFRTTQLFQRSVPLSDTYECLTCQRASLITLAGQVQASEAGLPACVWWRGGYGVV